MRNLVTAGILAASLVTALPRAEAGRGSSPGAIASAISSNSVDAISSELERAEHLVCPSCVPLVRPLVDHPDRRVRQVAAWWLSRRGLQQDLLDSMTARFAESDSIKARNAADVLGGLRSPKAIGPLSVAMRAPQFAPDARAAMARALGEIGDKGAEAPLGQVLADTEAVVRAAALEGLRQLRGFEDPSAAVPLLGDADPRVRIEAIYTIGATRSKALAGRAATATVNQLVGLVAGDESPAVRKKAAWALGEIGAPAAVAASVLGRAAEKDPDPLVRSLANAALGKLAR